MVGIRIFLAALAIGGMAQAALAAPLDDGGSRTGPQAAAADTGLPVHPALRAKAAASVADSNGDRLSDALEARLAGAGGAEALDVVVTFSTATEAAAVQQAVGAFGVTREFHLIDGFAATMSAAQVRALTGVAGVFRIEEDFTVTANLEAARRDFGAERARTALSLTGAGVGICVVDTGVNPDHEQFVDEGTGIGKVFAFKDFVGDMTGVVRTVAYDDHGHGTHVASTAAGDGTGGALAALLRGVAPGAAVAAAKVLDFAGSGANSGVIAGVEWCVDQPGVDVINLSLGNTGSSDGRDSLSQAVDAAVAAGKVVIVAAGNEGGAPNTIGTPAAARQAVTVGAVAEWSADPADPWFSGGLFPAAFSSRGPTKDGRIKPDIMAPGHSIAAAYVDVFGFFGCGNGCYAVLSGTSMAAPFVAGAAALIIESDPTLSPAQVQQAFYGTARDRGLTAGKDDEWGHGVIDVYSAVRRAGGASPDSYDAGTLPAYATGSGSVADNAVTRIPIEVSDITAPLAVTVTIDGGFKCFQRLGRTCLSGGWEPDLEARLLDPAGNPYKTTDIFGFEVPLPGTESTCPAGNECGAVGRQETLYFIPSAAGTYILEVFPFDGAPNNGTGGTFSYEVSHGPVAIAAPSPETLQADAGGDLTVTDSDNNGDEPVALDGVLSTGDIAAYEWRIDGSVIATGMAPTVTLGVGSYTVTLTVTSADGSASADTLAVTVKAKKGGGKGGGGGRKK